MSVESELKSHADGIELMRFFAGSDRGVCVEVTECRVDGGYIQLTRAQAAALAADLMDFAQGREVEFFEIVQ